MSDSQQLGNYRAQIGVLNSRKKIWKWNASSGSMAQPKDL
jgi:hypothetical protein